MDDQKAKDRQIIDYFMDKINSLAIPERVYENVNRSALRTALTKYQCSKPFEEMANILRNGLKNKANVPEMSKIINELTAISVSSAEGNVYAGGVQHIDKMLVIKYNKPSSNNDHMYSLKKEFIIGHALNSIRDQTCNFVYTYTNILCPAKNVLVKGEQSLICEDRKDSSVAQHNLIEYIEGKTLSSVISDQISMDELGKILLCIFCALHIANKKIGFCHYDLHGGNVIIREEQRPITLEYKIGNETIYVNTKYIPVIIDYGLARAKILDGKNMYTLKKRAM